MIYIISGDDLEKKTKYINDIVSSKDFYLFDSKQLNKNILLEYASTQSLFGESPVVIVDNLLNDSSFDFNKNDLEILSQSNSVFIFKEDKILALQEKKYSKYAEIKKFDIKKGIKKEKFNSFSIADAFGRRDKFATWSLYRLSVEYGIEPETVCGIIFWKVKSLILNGSKLFSENELKTISSEILSLYHKAHRGEGEMSILIEKLILSSLSSSKQ